MATLNGIAENIAFKLGDQFNDTLNQSIKDSIVDIRATLIRQDLERNPMSYTDYLQTLCVELESVNRSECPELPTCGEYLRSKVKIPKPLRIKGNGRTNFKFVGAVNRSKAFTFATAYEMNMVGSLPFQKNVIYYTYLQGRLFILNNMKLKKILLEYIVVDPRKIGSCDEPHLFPDDREFPIPLDMLTVLKDKIASSFRREVEDGKEINIDKDDNN